MGNFQTKKEENKFYKLLILIVRQWKHLYEHWSCLFVDHCTFWWRRQWHPLQYPCLENPWTEGPGRLRTMGSLSRTRLSDFTFTFHFHALEKEMATHPSVLAWRFPGTGEPGGLPSMGSHRVRHDWSDLAAAAAHSEHFFLKLMTALKVRSKR